MIRKTLAASAVLLSVFTANALAATTMCPSVASITQKQEEQGYSYSAPGPNGRVWVGENPYASEGDLETFVFTGALYRTVSSEGNTDVVSCDYEGDDWYAFARMTLYSFREWAPVKGTKWEAQPIKEKAGASNKAKSVEHCDSRVEKECEFNYRVLTMPPTGH
ncbi:MULTISPECIES: hypothetical protein [unclassified Pseudomonas]|uniref:hypothetical protein n=1 Tax=Pseudomonas sp. A-R-26 TaxID=2832404 RepID=UPI001CBB4C51|nr:hypothetical protein [Pseudomonas sp. A-R-26]